MGELSLSEFDCTVIKSEAVFAVTDARLIILKLGGAESAFLDLFATRLAVPGWGGEAGDAVKEVSLTISVVPSLFSSGRFMHGGPLIPFIKLSTPAISIRFQE